MGLKNKHVEGVAGLLSLLIPSVPLAKAAKNTVHPKSQARFFLYSIHTHTHACSSLSLSLSLSRSLSLSLHRRYRGPLSGRV
jgi:hypothetical protein